MNSILFCPRQTSHWRAVFGFVLPVCVFAAGCANHNQTTGIVHPKSPHELVTFYAVPLRCPAALEIGCGSRAKPILRELENAPGIEEAWLNRAGTQLAIVWAGEGSSKMRLETLEPLLKRQKLTATELKGTARAQTLKGFQTGSGWLRADAVDRLSEEEAQIIARRLVRRVESKTPLAADKATKLRNSVAETLEENFIGSSGKPRQSAEQERAAFFAAAAHYLNETELTVLREAVTAGFRALPGEE